MQGRIDELETAFIEEQNSSLGLMSQNEVLNLVSKSYYSYNQILQEKDTKKLRDDLEVKLQSIKDQAWFENKIKVLETLNEELKWKNE